MYTAISSECMYTNRRTWNSIYQQQCTSVQRPWWEPSRSWRFVNASSFFRILFLSTQFFL